jgi:carboxylesterase type B
LGTWPRFTAEERQTMVFDAKSVVVTDPLAAQRGWWDGLWDADGCRPSGVPL